MGDEREPIEEPPNSTVGDWRGQKMADDMDLVDALLDETEGDGPVPPSRWGPPADGPHTVLWSGRGRQGDPHGSEPDPALLAIAVDQVIAAAEARLRSGTPPAEIVSGQRPGEAPTRDGAMDGRAGQGLLDLPRVLPG